MSEIVSTDDTLGGEPRIAGRRISILHIADRVIDRGERPEDVATDYQLDLADIHHALVYYYDHPEEMQHWREQKRAAGRRARQRRFDPEQHRYTETA